MRPLNVNYDGTGWNADYVAGVTEDEFVREFSAQYYGHVENIKERIKATESAYRFIIQEYQKINPKKVIEKPKDVQSEGDDKD